MSKVAVIFLTPSCNMHCDFCGAEAGFSPIPAAEAENLIRRLASEGFQSVVFGGGEPFLWPHDLLGLAKFAKGLGLITQVGTNATLVPERADILHGFDRWILPMEALDDKIHDHMRHFEDGHLNHITRLLLRLKAACVQATISSLVTAENIDSLLDVGAYLSWFQKQGGLLHAWHLYRFLPVGRGGALHGDRFSTTSEHFEDFGALVKNRFPDLKIYLRPDMYHSKVVSFYWWQGGALKSLESKASLKA